MKRYFAVFLLAVFSLSLLSGCGLFTFTAKLDAAENAAEQKLDEMEKAAEAAAQAAVTGGTADQPAGGEISGEEARNIALAHAGLAEGDVQGLRAEYEIDDGVPHYDVTFRVGRLEYEYEIHAETGEILSFERDD